MKNKHECDRHKCQGCPMIDHCYVRMREWVKGIDTIMNGWPRPQGEGKKMAQELIDYMQNDFNG